MMGYGWGMGAGGWIAMTVFWIALLVLVVWGVTRLLPSGGRGSDTGAPRAETPEEILDRRFALGEIDEETYQRMRTQLTSARSGRR
jgi:putative membrane protein